MTKLKYLNLRPAEVARFLRPSGLVVIPVKQRLPSSDEVRKQTGIDYGWMQCNDFGKPDEFRVVGPVGVVRDFGGPTLLKCPLGGPGSEWVGREAWFPCSTFDPSEETGAIYRADAWRNGNEPNVKWKPASSMPDWAARIRKTTTRVELRRVRTISDDEIKATGITPDRATDHPRGVWCTAFMAEFNARYPGAWDRDVYAWFVFYTDTH